MPVSMSGHMPLWSSLAIIFVLLILLLMLITIANAKGDKTSKSTKKKTTKLDSKSEKKTHKPSKTTKNKELIEEEKMSCWQLCGLLCCPPCPSSIAEKLAFRPPKATYSIMDDRKGPQIRLSGEANWYYSAKQLSCIQVVRSNTARGNRIVCMFIRGPRNPKYTVLFSHGNAADLGQMATCYFQLSRWVNVNVFSYDYSGYGASTGHPSEANLYADIDAAFESLGKHFKVPPNRTILYGQSIGSAPTIDLASRQLVAGVVLQSAFTSGMRLVCEDVHTSRCCDTFLNIDKAERVQSPVLVIHGTADDVIDIDHGIELYKTCPRTVDACWIHNANHNDIMAFAEFYTRMSKFIVELDQIEMKHIDV